MIKEKEQCMDACLKKQWEKENISLKIIFCLLYFILALILIPGISLFQGIIAIGSLSTAVGVFLAFFSLRESHDWNRRQYTIEYFSHWNEGARKHLNILEKEFPDMLNVPDFIANPELMNSWCLNDDKSKMLVGLMSNPQKNCSDMDTRSHLLELFNDLEGIALAYEQCVVDRLAVEDCYGTVILDIWIYFQPFIQKMREVSRRDPWPPLSRMTELWLREAVLKNSQVQATDASRRHEEAIKKYGAQMKNPTGI
jgi:hypothetical protein